MTRFSLLYLLALMLFVPSDPTSGQQTQGFHIINKYTLGGEGGWDYLTLDGDARRLYIARANRVMVMDVDKGILIGEVKNTSGAHGVALIPKRNRGYVSNGGASTVTVFDLTTLKEVNRIKVGQWPDAILYDVFSNQVFTGNALGDMTVIDAQTEKVVGTIKLAGKPEAIVNDEKGHLYVNLENKNEVLAIDVKKMTVIHRWPLSPGEEPTGLAIDRVKNRLFASCHNGKMVILDADNGKLIDSPSIGKGTDACSFDPELGLAFSSNGDGTMSVVQENKSGRYELIANVKTEEGARTMALDGKTHHLFLATATAKPGQKRIFEPGTFVILEVAK